MKSFFSVLMVLAFACISFAQINVDTSAVGDVGVAGFKKVAKDIPFAFRSSKLSLSDPQYSVGGYDIDTFMKKVFIPALAKVVNALPAGKKVVIKGHANAVGPEEEVGQYGGNIMLSEERAQAVFRYLKKNSKLNPDKFKVVGVGSSQPAAGLSPEDKKNCRVSFDIE